MTNLLQPDEALAVIIGDAPLTRTEVVKKLWGYIRENGLQDAKNPHYINADDNLRKVFGGKDQVSMFEITKLVNRHVAAAEEVQEEVVKELAEELLWSAYEVLDCSIDMSDEEIRRQYRELYHWNSVLWISEARRAGPAKRGINSFY